ncbi:hypothetical protein [Sphingomonas sp. DT-204]|uniref:hypothetical protein n=1 Tax=Sphingomonas sp. DT-204 TaxID=3396166 RepID=UPI003F1CC9FD
MAEVQGLQSNSFAATLPPPPPPSGNAGGPAAGTDPFFEPVGNQWIARNGSQPVAQWIGGLSRNDVGLSTLDRWQAGSTAEATARQIETQLRAEIAPPTGGPLAGATLLDAITAPFDDVKVGYAMGQVAAGIEARIAADPDVPSANAAALATELRNRGAALSLGAAREATTQPGHYAFDGACYSSADALARAVTAERLNPTRTSVSAYTPEMARRDQQAAMDRAVLGQSSPLGMTWGQTAYMYARGTGASLEGQQRAYAAGTAGDALLGIGGAFVGVGAARGGLRLPGGQAAPSFRPTSTAPRTEPLPAPPGTVPVYLGRASNLSAGLGQVQGTYTGLVSAGTAGPLPSNLAGTFAGGRYDVVRLSQDTILYRAGTADKPLGQFFSLREPQGVLQTRMDQAVLPRWPDGGSSPLDTAFAVRIPAGTEVYVGRISAQGGIYGGGTDQILVRQPWTIDGVQVVGARPIR